MNSKSKRPFGENSIARLYADHKNYTCKPNIIYRVDRENADSRIHKTSWLNGIIPD